MHRMNIEIGLTNHTSDEIGEIIREQLNTFFESIGVGQLLD
jgi:hypothetical protein